jgi:hypothetical protein
VEEAAAVVAAVVAVAEAMAAADVEAAEAAVGDKQPIN